jgi:serine/threonine protein kinase
MGWNDLIGMRLDQYDILDELGRGGSSRVYRAFDTARQRDVAIKVIPNDADDRSLFLNRFQNEVKAVQKLHDPNIVAVFGAGENDEFVYLVMQCVTGGTLRKQLNGPLPVSVAAEYMVQIANALQHAHGQLVIHRDVKPSNMLLEYPDSKHLLLTDFGIAKIQGARGMTKSGTTIGTPEYMSPEQAEGRDIDVRSDIYALGCVLYETLAGRPPFRGATAVSVLFQQVHSRPPYIRGFNPSVPAEVVHVLEIALAKRPDDRYASAEEFAQALLPFAGELPDVSAQQPDAEPIVISRSRGLTPSRPMTQSQRLMVNDIADRDTLENPTPPTRRGGREETTAPLPALSSRKTHPPFRRPQEGRPPSRTRKTLPPFVRVRRAAPMSELNVTLDSPDTANGPAKVSTAGGSLGNAPGQPISLPIRSRAPGETAASEWRANGGAFGQRGPTSQPSPGRNQVNDSRIPATWPTQRRPRWRLVTLIAAVIVLGLFVGLALNASGHGLPFGNQFKSSANRQKTQTAVPTSTTAPTATAVPTVTAGPQPTATATQQQILNQEAYASFRAVTLATFGDGSCSGANARAKFNSGQAIYVNLCTSGNAISAPMTVTIRHNGQVLYTMVSGRYISQSSSYYYYTTHPFNSGTYDVFVTLTINGTTAVARDLTLYIR